MITSIFLQHVQGAQLRLSFLDRQFASLLAGLPPDVRSRLAILLQPALGQGMPAPWPPDAHRQLVEPIQVPLRIAIVQFPDPPI